MAWRTWLTRAEARRHSLITERPTEGENAKQPDGRVRRAFVPVVKVKENESFEQALRRFKKQVEKAGILTELRRRESYDKPSVRRKKKAAAARKRALKKLKRMAR